MASPHDVDSPAIILATLNAKYIHASLGLRYLLANMGELKARTVLREFTIARKPQEVVDELLALLGEPPGGAIQIIGLGVYIWNVTQTCEVLRLLKAARPDVTVVLGGPEVSHEVEQQEIVRQADFVITGWGDVSFPRLCRALLSPPRSPIACGSLPPEGEHFALGRPGGKTHGPQPLMKVIAGEQPPLDHIALPYAGYSDADLAHRLLYVEASRGCPFKCEFCLSSLDQTAWAFVLDMFLAAMQVLHDRGARNFKFVDRTFNLRIDASVRILQFFLERLTDDLFLHFEVVPDHLPERLKAMIARFPAGVLQLEIGIQSFNVEVQQRISRRQDNEKTEANLRWLATESQAHLHTDLIFGLPGETLASFATGFDRLVALQPHEIQLGILKRLRGTTIARHSEAFAIVYNPRPPYSVLQTGAVDADTVQRFARFSRYWDLVANSGRFRQTLRLLLEADANANPQAGSRPNPVAPSAFYAFLAFADWLWQTTGVTSGLSPEALVDALFDYLCIRRGLPAKMLRETLLADYIASGARASPRALQGLLPKQRAPKIHAVKTLAQRQERHLPAPSAPPQHPPIPTMQNLPPCPVSTRRTPAKLALR